MADSDDIDLYAILGVSKRASISDIKKVSRNELPSESRLRKLVVSSANWNILYSFAC